MPSLPPPGIRPHDGTAETYSTWRKDATNHSVYLFSEVRQSPSHGLAFDLLGHDDYVLAFTNANGPPADFVPPPPPGNPPLNVTNQETRFAYEQFEKRSDLVADYVRSKKELTIALVSSLHATTVKNLEDPLNGMFNLTPNEIYAYMKSTFGKVTVPQLKKLDEDLRTIFKPGETDISAFIANFKFTTRAFAQAGEPLSMHSQVTAMKDNVAKCQLFDEVLVTYERNFTAAGSQNLDTLGTILIAEAERKRTMATSGTTGFGNAAVSSFRGESEADLRRIFDDLFTERCAYAAVPAEQKAAATPREADLLKANEHLTRRLAQLTKQDLKTCRCGIEFSSHNPDHDTCFKCFHKDKDKERNAKAKGNKEKGRGGEKKK
jgi:hypothetical protein